MLRSNPFTFFATLTSRRRYNNRNMDDIHRFVFGMRHIVGRRLTYAQLTGKLQVAHG